jgi:Brp/Blh family beta-carotene 15,15'-monooxygenase
LKACPEVPERRPPVTASLFSVLFPALTLVLVLASAWGISPGTPLILILLVAGVVILGLPHGALDPLVAMQLWSARQSFTLVRFLLVYTGVAGLCVAIWMIAPNAALVGFLIISAYHFGSDWDGRCTAWGQVAFGMSIVSVSTLFKANQVEAIYTQLGASVAHQIVIVSQVIAVAAIVAALFAASSRSKFRASNLLELSTVLVGGLVLPPLLFFTCYFCLLHSPRHLMQTAGALGLRGVRDTARAAAPTVLATLVLGIGLWIVLPGSIYSQKVVQLVFIGLAALTAPHMLLTEFNRQRAPPNLTKGHGDVACKVRFLRRHSEYKTRNL